MFNRTPTSHWGLLRTYRKDSARITLILQISLTIIALYSNRMSMSLTTLVSELQKQIENFDPIQNVIYGIVLILAIVFSDKIPLSYRTFLDSTVGRIVAVLIVVLSCIYVGPLYGVLAVLAVLLILSGRPVVSEEGFFDVQIKKDTIGNNWLVESVLSENPNKINTDVVRNSENQLTNDVIGRRWHSERVMGENPNRISTTAVITPIVSDET